MPILQQPVILKWMHHPRDGGFGSVSPFNEHDHARFWEKSRQRGQPTTAVWATHSTTFQVGAWTLTAHTNDVALLFTQANQRWTQKDVLDDAMLVRDANFNAIRDIIVRVAATD